MSEKSEVLGIISNVVSTRTGPYHTVENVAVNRAGQHMLVRQLTVSADKAAKTGMHVEPDAVYVDLTKQPLTRGDMVLFAAAPLLEEALMDLVKVAKISSNPVFGPALDKAEKALEKAQTFYNELDAYVPVKASKENA